MGLALNDAFSSSILFLPQLSSPNLTENERQLLLEYKTKETTSAAAAAASSGLDLESVAVSSCSKTKAAAAASKSHHADADGYEKPMPKHGDTLWHKFVSIIQENPGQMLRSDPGSSNVANISKLC